MVDISRMPVIAISSVRGIGVADMVSTSTAVRSCLSVSLCSTPNRCSSSTTMRPSCLNRVARWSSRCVPMMMSAVPSAALSIATSASLAVWNRESCRISIGNCAIRSENVLKCCCASNVVGTSTATCLPSCTALNAARTAISVLP